MGVKGLWQYIEHHHITYLPPKDNGKGHTNANSSPSAGNSNGTKRNPVPYALRPRHLFLDMNAILHVSYSAQRATSNATLEAVRQRVLDIIRRMPPSETLVLAFDGVAPVAKLVEQKARRKGLSPEPPRDAPRPTPAFAGSPMAALFTCDYVNTVVPLRQEQITAGSEFVFLCEKVICECLQGMLKAKTASSEDSKSPVTWQRLLVSSCTEPGEGEVKIARYLRELWQQGTRDGTYDAEKDVITIVGNDSDLILVALCATPYRYLTVVDPVDFTMTCLSELMDHWSSAVPNPPLSPDLLPSYRLDFVFLMLLSGCDYYDGVRHHAVELWRRYRDLRANHGFFRKALVSGEDFVVDVNFLRRVTEKVKQFVPQRGRQKGGSHRRAQHGKSNGGEGSGVSAASAAQGVELLRATLWNFKGYVLGRCVDYQYISPIKRGGEIGVGALRAAAQRPGIAHSIGASVTDGTRPPTATTSGYAQGTEKGGEEAGEALPPTTEPPLSVLEQCLAVLGNRGRYSRELQLTMESFTPDNGCRLTTSQSTRYLIDSVKELVSHMDTRRLSGAEQALLSRAPHTASEEAAEAEKGFLRHAAIPSRSAAKRSGAEETLDDDDATVDEVEGGGDAVSQLSIDSDTGDE